MYSDLLFNFYQMTENEGLDRGAEILSEMARTKPFFAVDSGVRADDIFLRAKRVHQCLELIEDEDEKSSIERMMYFTAGIMGDYDSVFNRFEYVENLEENIKDFKNSDDEFASKLIAIGPAGIDHDWESVEYKGRDHDYFDSQTIEDEKDLFALQLTLAKKLNMPFILHSRKGFKDTIDVLKAIKYGKGAVHGYSYSKSELDFFLDMGWYISFSGSITYSGNKMFNDMAEVVSYVPKDRILIESDSPYYAPVPIKNSENTPANIRYVYEYIMAKRNISTLKLSEIVDENFKKLFCI